VAFSPCVDCDSLKHIPNQAYNSTNPPPYGKKQTKTPGLSFLRMSNSRWKWMAGATAVTAAGVTASQATTITINLVNNYISATDGNHLNADLTGDGHPDLTMLNFFHYRFISPYRTYATSARVGVDLNGVRASASWSNDFVNGFARLGSREVSYSTFSLMGSVPIFFKDLHINGGAPTSGSLEVTVSARSPLAIVQLDSLTYTSNAGVQGSTRAVPDHGSTLALLAMGAGGILALRRRRAAQEHS
jgi:protein with PEP-CTERM/exosortase system signal